MKKSDKLKISASVAGFESDCYSYDLRADEFKKIEACYSALNAAKAFTLNFKHTLKKTSNAEVDKYVKAIVEQTDKSTINFLNYCKQLLDFIHSGVSGVRVVWAIDESGSPFPAYSYSLPLHRIALKNGKYHDLTNGKDFDPTLYYFIAEQIGEKGFKKDLLDAIEADCKIIQAVNKTLLPAVRKYKNPPKVTMVKPTGVTTTDAENCKITAENLAGLNENSEVALTGVEKIFVLPLADLEKLLKTKDASVLSILRAYLGHSEAIQGGAGGNNTKMISVLKIIYHYAIFRASLLENAINQLIENIVYARWGFDAEVPYLKFDLRNKPDSETLLSWFKEGALIDKELIYEYLGGEPAAGAEFTVKKKD